MTEKEKEMIDEKEEETKETGEKPQEEAVTSVPDEESSDYDDEWDRLEEDGSEEGSDLAAKSDDEELPEKDDEKDHSDPAPEGKAAEEELPSEGKGKESPHGDERSISKALADTKAFATKLANEKKLLEERVKDLQMKVDAMGEGSGGQNQVDEAQTKVDESRKTIEKLKEDTESLYEEYPELKVVLSPMVEMMEKLQTETIKRTEQSEREKAIQDFETNVAPKVAEVHPDFLDIVKSEDYWKWAGSLPENTSLWFAANYSNDPGDIVNAISQFKKIGAKDEVKGLEQTDKQQKTERIVNAQTLKPQGANKDLTRKELPQDYDGGWEEAEKLLKNEGIV